MNDKAFVELGVSRNQQLGLRELRPTKIKLQLEN